MVTFRNTNSVPGGALITWFVSSVYEGVFPKQQTDTARVGDVAHWLRLTSKYSVIYGGGLAVTIGVGVGLGVATGPAVSDVKV